MTLLECMTALSVNEGMTAIIKNYKKEKLIEFKLAGDAQIESDLAAKTVSEVYVTDAENIIIVMAEEVTP